MASESEGKNGFGTFSPCSVNECEGGFGFASGSLEALAVVIGEFVRISVERTEG